MQRFYVVKDEKDLFSGDIIPRKVMNYLPMGYGMGMGMVRPMPIQKSPEFIISPSVGPMFPTTLPGYGPTLSLSGKMPPQLLSASNTLVNPYGPPIIKMGPLVQSGAPGKIIITSNIGAHTLHVPPTDFRNVINYIYYNAFNGLGNVPKVKFNVIAPGINSNVETTQEKMLEILKTINDNYPGVIYHTPGGYNNTVGALLNVLANKIQNQT